MDVGPRWTSTELMKAHYEEIGWRVTPIPGDGNCLFRALSAQIYGEQEHHMAVRQALANFMLGERDLFAPYIEGDNLSMDDYCARLRQDGEWGGHPELVAATRCFDVALVVHDGPQRQQQIHNEVPEHPNAGILHLGYTGNHYCSLHPVDVLPQQPHLTSSSLSQSRKNCTTRKRKHFNLDMSVATSRKRCGDVKGVGQSNCKMEVAANETKSETNNWTSMKEAAGHRIDIQDKASSPRYELKLMTKDRHTSVICKLAPICAIPSLVTEIQRTCNVMKQVQLEGAHLANLHLLRCLKDGNTLPLLDQMFFYRCCMATLGDIEQRDRDYLDGEGNDGGGAGTRSNRVKYPSLHTTFQRYWEGRESVVSFSSRYIESASDMVNEMAALMSINARNMVALEFRRRLHMFIRFRFAHDGHIELNNDETNRLVASCYRVRTFQKLDKHGNPTGETEKLWTKWDDTQDPVELQLRALGMVPWQWQIRENSSHFLIRLRDILVFMERFTEEHPKVKGAKLFSLLPVSRAYHPAYVKLNASTLYGIFKHVEDDPLIQCFLTTGMNIDPHWTEGSSMRPFTKVAFQTHRCELMRRLFHVSRFETRNRKFANEIKTNGYGASITMIRPVTSTSVVVKVNAGRSKQAAVISTKKIAVRKVVVKSSNKKVSVKVKHHKVSTKPTGVRKSSAPRRPPEELTDKNKFAKELFKLGPEYAPDVLIGIDPGLRSLATAVSVGKLPRRRQKSRRGLHPRSNMRRKLYRRQRSRMAQNESGRQRSKERVVEISTREYRHLARMNDFELCHERLKERRSDYANVIEGMPSFKTASYDTYRERLDYFWKHVGFLVDFSVQQAFVRWRFTRARAKMKALHTLAKRLVPVPSKQVCIGFGDWSRRDGIKGHPTGPVKGFAAALKRRATVVPIDEFRTSITCSRCHHRMEQARLFTKTKRDEDEGDIRQKVNRTAKEENEVVEMAKFRNPKLADMMVVLKPNRNVLRCINSRCKANFWNRDVNAARNMLELLRAGLNGKHGSHRLRAFRRGQPF